MITSIEPSIYRFDPTKTYTITISNVLGSKQYTILPRTVSTQTTLVYSSIEKFCSEFNIPLKINTPLRERFNSQTLRRHVKDAQFPAIPNSQCFEWKVVDDTDTVLCQSLPLYVPMVSEWKYFPSSYMYEENPLVPVQGSFVDVRTVALKYYILTPSGRYTNPYSGHILANSIISNCFMLVSCNDQSSRSLDLFA